MIELIPVPLDDRGLVRRFVRIPWYINRVHYPATHWVPPVVAAQLSYLDARHNPFFDHADAALWIARVDGVDVGRIAAVHDHDWVRFQGTPVGTFGMFESPNASDVANALFDAARAWLRKRSLDRVIGPFDLSTTYAAGILVDNFDKDPYIQMAYNPPYYEDLFLQSGFRPAKDIWQWGMDLTEPLPERVERLAAYAAKRTRATVRPMDLRDWDAEVARIHSVYNDAWRGNWGFVPVSLEELSYLGQTLKLLVVPELALVAELDSEPIGICISLANINALIKDLDGCHSPLQMLRLWWRLRRPGNIQSGRLALLGVRPAFQGRGIDALLLLESYKAARRIGWQYGELGWTLDDNVAVNRTVEAFNGKRVKSYRVYESTSDNTHASPY